VGRLRAIAVVRYRTEEDNAFTVLDLDQVRELRDGLRSPLMRLIAGRPRADRLRRR
jgi:hypothetical protein